MASPGGGIDFVTRIGREGEGRGDSCASYIYTHTYTRARARVEQILDISVLELPSEY